MIPFETMRFVTSEASEADCERLQDVLTARRRQLREAQAAHVQVGSYVVLHGMSPKYLNGMQGTVLSIDGGRCVLRLTAESTSDLRYWCTARWAPRGDVVEFEFPGIPLTGCRIVGKIVADDVVDGQVVDAVLAVEA